MPLRPLSKELQTKAIKELNEDPKKIQQNLQAICDWAKAQPHLKIRTDEQWLLNFLRGCKFNLDLAKEKLDMLYTLKTHLPEFFSNRDPFLPEIQELLKLGTCLPLPKTADPTSPRVVLVRAETINPDLVKTEDGIKLMLMIIEILLYEDDNCVVSGGNLFVDNTGLTMNHLFQIPAILPKASKCLKGAYCLNPEGFYAINVPPFALTAFEVYKSMADEKLLKMVHIYSESNTSELYKHIPLSILPEEYGGTGGSVAELTDYWKQKVESYKDWFLEDAQYGCDETKRPGGPKLDTDLFKPFAMPRRKLEID